MRKLLKIIGSITAVIVLILAVYLGFTAIRWMHRGSGLQFADTASVVREVQSLSDLVTVKYVMEKVVVLDDAKWYGDSRVLLLAHGIVKAGIDLKRLKPAAISISGKTISLKLPPAQITDAYLDEKATKVIDHTTGIMRSYDKSLEQKARQNAVDDIERAARQDGILDEATKRGREELTNFLKRAGFEQVEFR